MRVCKLNRGIQVYFRIDPEMELRLDAARKDGLSTTADPIAAPAFGKWNVSRSLLMNRRA
jgi:hypothetical protein